MKPQSIFQQVQFFTTADEMSQLPRLGLPEVAFAGRSNAGKSTALNALCQQRRLAFSSKTPGRTQHLNYFAIGKHPEEATLPAGFLVDLPGYGYAEVSQSSKAHWNELLSEYLRLRSELAALVLIMDARRPMTELDQGLLDWFGATGKPVLALLTKADKLTRTEASAAMREAKAGLAGRHPDDQIILFSSLKRVGLDEVHLRILDLLGIPFDPPSAVASKTAVTARPKGAATTQAAGTRAGEKKAPAQGE